MDLGVIGAGYVGLVTSACLAHLGHRVICVDIDKDRIARLSRGEVPISEPGLSPMVADGLHGGRLTFTTELRELRGSSLAIVAVGTLDGSGEWTDQVVRSAVLGLAADRSGPRSIVIRSTLLPGTASRLSKEVAELDPRISLALNPEFTREGNAVADFLQPDRVIIGTQLPDSPIVRDLRRIYEPLEAQIMVTDLTSAEMIKLASNVFLAAKITFANELARICASNGASVAAVVDGMGLDRRIGRAFLSPGPGYGGSCFPAQARALPTLAERSGISTPLIDTIARSNDGQAAWFVNQAATALGRDLDGARVAVLGLTFKAGTDDLRESPALNLVAELASRGANLTVHDPIATASGVSELARRGVVVRPASTVVKACDGADIVFVATEWFEYADIDWADIQAVMAGDNVVDCRGIVSAERATAAGLRVLGLRRRPNDPMADRPPTTATPVGPGIPNVIRGERIGQQREQVVDADRDPRLEALDQAIP
jgi:UDPglucose 6-dehydrogenase